MSAAPDPRSRKRSTNLQPVPRLALTPTEAAAAIGCSRAFFDEHVLPELRVVRRSKLIFIPVVEVERWLSRSAALTLEAKRP